MWSVSLTNSLSQGVQDCFCDGNDFWNTSDNHGSTSNNSGKTSDDQPEAAQGTWNSTADLRQDVMSRTYLDQPRTFFLTCSLLGLCRLAEAGNDAALFHFTQSANSTSHLIRNSRYGPPCTAILHPLPTPNALGYTLNKEPTPKHNPKYLFFRITLRYQPSSDPPSSSMYNRRVIVLFFTGIQLHSINLVPN